MKKLVAVTTTILIILIAVLGLMVAKEVLEQTAAVRRQHCRI